MPISPALAQPPTGLGALQPPSDFDPAELEIEIDNPDEVKINGIAITPDKEDDFGANLAEDVSEAELTKIASELLADYEEILCDLSPLN